MFEGQTGGWLEVVCRSMFSGKSEELIRRVKRARIARQKVQVFIGVADRFGIDARDGELLRVDVGQVGESGEIAVKVAVMKRRVRSGAASPFPLGFRGKRASIARLLGEPPAERHRIAPGDADHRAVRAVRIVARPGVVLVSLIVEPVEVVRVEAGELLAGHFDRAHIERPVDPDRAERLFVGKSLPRAHDELTFGYQLQFDGHSITQGQ